MGLDMYLYKRHYNEIYDFKKKSATAKKLTYKVFTEFEDGETKEQTIEINNPEFSGATLTPFAYWRKANAIHRWILEATDSEDKCQLIYIDGEKLKKLAEACKTVLNNHDLAEEVLPTQQGFFFGDTDYDEYYFEELQRTYDMLKDIDWQDSFYYQASW